jgi:hypothetical protein
MCLIGRRYGHGVIESKMVERKHGAVVWELLCDCGNRYKASTNMLYKGSNRSCGCQPRAHENLEGNRYGKGVVQSITDERRHGNLVWELACDCGNRYKATTNSLNRNRSLSCGCHLKRCEIGRRYGRGIIQSRLAELENGMVVWELLCDCGNGYQATTRALSSGKRSCGCTWRTMVDGLPMSKHPLCCIWRNMVRRCCNPKDMKYPDYGGRGIRVCERWMTFQHFVQDIGDRPGLDYTLDRIDNDGHYELENVRWATKSVQNMNRRRSIRNSDYRKLKQENDRLHLELARLMHTKKAHATRQTLTTGLQESLFEQI